MAKSSPESGQRHNPELFKFSPEAEEKIARGIASLGKQPVSDEALASLKETLPLSTDELIARYKATLTQDSTE